MFDLAISFFTEMIIEISMNLYIWAHSLDESDTEEYMKFSKKCYIGCMAAYTSGDYFYLKNMNHIPDENMVSKTP